MALLARHLGAAALLAVALDHLEQRSAAHYAAIPTISTLFLLNFVSATVVAVGLALPLERLGSPAGRHLPRSRAPRSSPERRSSRPGAPRA
jgi:hypothetical protein